MSWWICVAPNGFMGSRGRVGRGITSILARNLREEEKLYAALAFSRSCQRQMILWEVKYVNFMA
jgi:hypothetical protein